MISTYLNGSWRDIIEARRQIAPIEKPLIAGFERSLQPHQKNGIPQLVSMLHTNHGAILADVMGLGKTLQAIVTALSYRKEKGNEGPILVVCPKSCIRQWCDELGIKNFDAGHLPKIKILNGLMAMQGWLKDMPDFVFCTYQYVPYSRLFLEASCRVPEAVYRWRW